MGKIVGIVGFITGLAVVALIVVFGPFTIIWAVNTLFTVGIAYTFKTWLAVVIMNCTVLGALNALSLIRQNVRQTKALETIVDFIELERKVK